jgi:hypothetical protein
LQIEDLWNRQGRMNLKSWQREIRSYECFSGTKIIVDAFFSSIVRGDFQNFGKFSKNFQNFTMVSDFFGEFSIVFGAAEKWKNNSGIYVSH